MIREFLTVYRMYRRHHPKLYAFSTAWRIAVRGLPF